jgi:hypothetical protein
MTNAEALETESRPEQSGRLLLDPLDTDPYANLRKLEEMEQLARFRRNQRWETSRQMVVLFWFASGSLLILIGAVASGLTLIMSDNEHNIHVAKWVLETVVGGLVAGLIGFWAVKSFEK